ncbi:hypothetical protein BDW02DRAFT_317692 [Decorospora gaudefroyi]|uniref:Uncharacterized protein n=1 Tax=Decorospora gaudefroyi TaxID=184978 RepID=A0A6A5KAJ6_9PLEO|nr:hypothetical protein BDW02DRAFT_317692 [Decorospora gaudefroyi]
MFRGFAADPIKTLLLLENLDLDLDATALELRSLDGNFPESRLTEALRYASHRWNRSWSHVSALLFDQMVWNDHPYLITGLIAEGFDPNCCITYAEDRFCSPLVLVFLRMFGKTWNSTDDGSSTDDGNSTENENSRAGEFARLMYTARALTRAGVNIYYINSEILDKASTWVYILRETLCTWASAIGIVPEWKLVLKECGLDPDKVFWEDESRCKQLMRLHGATRTGIDERVLEMPSTEGIRCRLCRGSYCDSHDRGVFGWV